MGVTSIDKNAFKGCEKLQSISIDTNNPDDYKRIVDMLPDKLKEIVKNTSLKKCTPCLLHDAAWLFQGFTF